MLTFAALIMSIVVSEYIQKLNDAQREAVVNFRCPSLIVAGAGSGKTRVLTCRIAYMLEQGVAPDTILALTFTNKAAAEMRERIGQLLSPQATRRIWMGTYHSLFSRILRAEADKLVADAKAEARKIVAEARAEAEEIVKKAEAKAEDVSKNTMTEISLAGKQAVSKIKQEIASLIIAKATAGGVKEAVVDPAFIKEMLVAVAKNWNGSDSGKVELQALLPEGERKKLDAAFEESAKELLAAGVEVGWSKEVKTGFKVGAKEGGYYISFADADIEALLAEYLRDKVFQLLFKA